MTIRPCRADDLGAVHSLLCELEAEALDYPATEAIYFEKLSDENCALLAADEDDKIIGFLSLCINNQLHHAAPVATIEELIVSESERGRGVGKALIARAVELSGEKNCDTIELTSNFHRADAHRFYENNGFERRSYKFTMRLRAR